MEVGYFLSLLSQLARQQELALRHCIHEVKHGNRSNAFSNSNPIHYQLLTTNVLYLIPF